VRGRSEREGGRSGDEVWVGWGGGWEVRGGGEGAGSGSGGKVVELARGEGVVDKGVGVRGAGVGDGKGTARA